MVNGSDNYSNYYISIKFMKIRLGELFTENLISVSGQRPITMILSFASGKIIKVTGT